MLPFKGVGDVSYCRVSTYSPATDERLTSSSYNENKGVALDDLVKLPMLKSICERMNYKIQRK